MKSTPGWWGATLADGFLVRDAWCEQVSEWPAGGSSWTSSSLYPLLANLSQSVLARYPVRGKF